ncbi:AraC family transcriptional regulator [Litoribrevibacter euphylliae]|uniref:AraC family transcriptional regulator n=1 Tax=Litoribrevibacter euphylliae TaxID=1834034 RepID=A0ABV7HBV0_9GAMM
MGLSISGSVSNASVLDLVETCSSLKVINEKILNKLGIDRSSLENPERRFPESKLITLWKWIDCNTVIPDIGLQIGQRVNTSSKGVLASWVSQCENLGEAIAIFIQNIPLMNSSESWVMRIDNESCVLVFSLDEDKGYPSRVVERSMSAMISWGRVLSAHAIPCSEVCFTFPKPAYHSALNSFFDCSVSYNAEHNALVFDKALLQLPILNGNQYLKAIMESKAQEIMNTITSQHTFAVKTNEVVRQALNEQRDINVNIVCKRMNVSRQTLYRKLKEEGTDFTSICDDIKKEEALRLLRVESESVTSVALSLGYKDNSSFYKAFKRWFGTSPSIYLARLDDR